MYGINKNYNKSTTIILRIVPFILPIVLVYAWQWGGETGKIITALFPPPTKLFETFKELLVNGIIWKNLSVSMLRVGKGFLLGASAGIILGFLMGLIKPIESVLSVLVSILRPIPFLAIIPIMIMLLGIGELEKTVVIAYGTFWAAFLNTVGGLQNVDIKLLEVAYLFRTSVLKAVFKIIVPAAIPSILTGLRLGISSAWMSVVGAEMIAASSGIGYLLAYSRTIARADQMYVCVLIIGCIGLILDKALVAMQKAYIKKTRGIEL